MQRRESTKLGDRVFRPPRTKPWQVSLPRIIPRKIGSTSSPLALIYGFAAIIAFGTILLMLPVSSKTGQFTSLVNALFTSTSAVCVTGLVVLDTGTYWNLFGQLVILLLIQVGGFGFMTSATVLFMMMGRRIGLRERLLIGESIGVITPGGMVKIVRRAARFTLIAEGIGFVILLVRFLLEGTSVGPAIWRALFHTISAFNNAGFDIFGNLKSLLDYQTDAIVLLTIGVLVILGGIGYIVVDDIIFRRRLSKLSADSKMVLLTTLLLLILGTLFYLAVEFSSPATLGPSSLPQKLLVSFFQALTPRTAGFTAVDIGKLMATSLFFTIFLMFIGGASGSTAGGVKVNTFGLLIAAVLSSLKGKEHASAFGREFDSSNIYRALALAIIYLGLVFLFVLLLSLTENFEFTRLLFETFSAFGTVGLSTGITPELSVMGRLTIIIAMFVGRLGPITFVSVIARRQQVTKYQYPKEIIRIG